MKPEKLNKVNNKCVLLNIHMNTKVVIKREVFLLGVSRRKKIVLYVNLPRFLIVVGINYGYLRPLTCWFSLINRFNYEDLISTPCGVQLGF